MGITVWRRSGDNGSADFRANDLNWTARPTSIFPASAQYPGVRRHATFRFQQRYR